MSTTVTDPEVYQRQHIITQTGLGKCLFLCFRGDQPGYMCWCNKTRFYVLEEVENSGDDIKYRPVQIEGVDKEELTLMD